RWTEQRTACDPRGTSHAPEIGAGVRPSPPHMVPGVVPHAMPFRTDARQDTGISGSVPADAEEGGLRPGMRQFVQYPGRHLRDRTIVEGQIEHPLLGRYAPGEAGQKPL